MPGFDKTNEFLALAESQRERTNKVLKPRTRQSKSEFSNSANMIGKGIQTADQKLKKLAKMVKMRNLYDDKSSEIQELTFLIKQDVKGLNDSVQMLTQSIHSGNAAKNGQDAHQERVVASLKSRLAETTNSFRDVLAERTDSLKESEVRKSRYEHETNQLSSSLSSRRGHKVSDDTASMNGNTGAVDGGSSRFSGLAESAGQWSGSQAMDLVPTSSAAYLQGRVEAVENIESTISELGGIFTQLATMVAEQGELVLRIDHDVDDTLHHVSEGQNQLMQYMNSIASNRGLYVKIFLVLIVFFLLFVLFVL